MTDTIVVMGPLIPEAMAVLAAHGEVRHLPTIAYAPLLDAVAAGVAAIIVRGVDVDAGLIDAAPALRVIGVPGVGLNRVDLAHARARGIRVVNTPGANAISVAELAIGLMVTLLRRIPQQNARVRREKVWEREQGEELCGKVLGLIGFGNVARRVAGYGRAMGLRALAFDPYVPEAPEGLARMVPLETLLAEAHIISVHAPLTDETRHLLNAERFALLRDGAYLVNTARGEIVDEAALEAALRSGKLRGAASDVLTGEALGAPIDSPLFDLENFIITPHLGAWTGESEARVGIELARRVVAALREREG